MVVNSIGRRDRPYTLYMENSKSPANLNKDICQQEVENTDAAYNFERRSLRNYSLFGIYLTLEWSESTRASERSIEGDEIYEGSLRCPLTLRYLIGSPQPLSYVPSMLCHGYVFYVVRTIHTLTVPSWDDTNGTGEIGLHEDAGPQLVTNSMFSWILLLTRNCSTTLFDGIIQADA